MIVNHNSTDVTKEPPTNPLPNNKTDKVEILFYCDLCTDGGWYVTANVIDDRMLFRHVYKKNSTHVLVGKEYIVYVLFMTSVHFDRAYAIQMTSDYIARHLKAVPCVVKNK